MELLLGGYKTCSKCGNSQSLIEFGQDRQKRDGLDSWCRTCRGRTGPHQATPGMAWTPSELAVRTKYGPSALFMSRICPICGDPATVVDHDHASGDTRGWLCHPCNILVGWLETRSAIVPNALAYIEGRGTP